MSTEIIPKTKSFPYTGVKIGSLADIIKITQGSARYAGKPGNAFFRGHANCTWKLIPRGGRELQSDLHVDQLFGDWRHKSGLFKEMYNWTEIEALAYAQHHGLATRLLDWSFNPLVALFFATAPQLDIVDGKYEDSHGALFVHFPKSNPIVGPGGWREALEVKHCNHGDGLRTPWFDMRMANQRGVFTFHSEANKEVRSRRNIDISKFVPGLKDITNPFFIKIPREFKPRLRSELSFLGIDQSFLFPDLDGLASNLNQLHCSEDFRRTNSQIYFRESYEEDETRDE